MIPNKVAADRTKYAMIVQRRMDRRLFFQTSADPPPRMTKGRRSTANRIRVIMIYPGTAVGYAALQARVLRLSGASVKEHSLLFLDEHFFILEGSAGRISSPPKENIQAYPDSLGDGIDFVKRRQDAVV